MLLWITAMVLGVHMAVWIADAVGRPSHGFVSYYAASRLLMQGADMGRFYDDPWFETQVARFEPTVIDIYGANLPTTSLLLVPLAALDYHTARVLWTGLSFLLLAGSVLWAAKLAGVEAKWTAVLLSLTFLYQPAYANLLHGQMYALALALLVVAWWGYRTHRDAATGASVGLLFVAKTTALMYWPLLFLRKRWRALLMGGTTAAFIGIASLPLLGVDAWRVYLVRARQLPAEPWLYVTNYQTIFGWFHHLLVYDARWNPHPVTDLPTLALALTWLAGVSMLAASGWIAVRYGGDLVFGGFAALSLMISPVSVDSHYAMALLPIVILMSALQHRMRSPEALLLVAAALLLAGDFPYRSPRVTTGGWALVAYPKLYGAFLLWALSLWLATRESRSPQPGAEPA